MTHLRIRKFNTANTYPEQKLNNDLCQAVVTQGGKIIWLRGQCPQNLDDAKNISSSDPAETNPQSHAKYSTTHRRSRRLNESSRQNRSLYHQHQTPRSRIPNHRQIYTRSASRLHRTRRVSPSPPRMARRNRRHRRNTRTLNPQNPQNRQNSRDLLARRTMHRNQQIRSRHNFFITRRSSTLFLHPPRSRSRRLTKCHRSKSRHKDSGSNATRTQRPKRHRTNPTQQ